MDLQQQPDLLSDRSCSLAGCPLQYLPGRGTQCQLHPLVLEQDRLQYKCEADEASKPVLVPSLILQPLVENSIKYVVACSQEGGEINLSVLVRDGRLIIRLSDSGKLCDQPMVEANQGSTKLGLKNVQQRLKNIYEEDHEFTIGDSEFGGFEVEMNLPAYTPG